MSRRRQVITGVACALSLIGHINSAQAAKWDSFIETLSDDTARIIRAKRAFYDGVGPTTPCGYIRPIGDAEWNRFSAVMSESASADDGYVEYLLTRLAEERQAESRARAECDAAFENWRIAGGAA